MRPDDVIRGATPRSILALGAAVLLAGCSGGASPTPTAAVTPAPPSVSPTQQPNPTPLPTVATLPIGRLAFDRFNGNAEGEYLGTFVLAAGAKSAVQLDLAVDANDAISPIWSPDGARLVGHFWTPDGGARLATVKPDGTSPTFLAWGVPGDFQCSAWTSDGTRLLCSRATANPSDDGIYELTVADGTLRRLTTSPYHDTVGSAGECGGGDGRGVYSPDGAMFAFIRQRCGSGPDPSSDEEGALIVGTVATGELTVIAPSGVRTHPGSELSWSPDGTWIAYATQEGDLMLIHPDGTGEHPVTVDAYGSIAAGPAWSPDGALLAVSTMSGGRLQSIVVITPDGSSRFTLPDTAGGAYPSWTGT